MIYVVGDIHGNFKPFSYIVLSKIKNMSKNKKINKEDIIITLGDVGLRYGGKWNLQLKEFFSELPCTWIIMRGNHDDRYWKDVVSKEVIDGETRWIAAEGWSFSNCFGEITLVEDKYPNIHYIDDVGGLYSIEGYSCAFIPGVYSVDKHFRLTNALPYCYEEQLTYSEMTKLFKAIKNKKLDFIFSHTCPMSIIDNFKKDLFLPFIDQNTVDNNMEIFLDNIDLDSGCDYKHWFFGHYHDDRTIEDRYTMLYNKPARLEDYV